MPILALIGLCLTMFSQRSKNKDIGTILLGFAVLMVGMDLMGDAVSGLKESESFRSILLMFENPVLGVLAGLVLTAVVQSSSASIGILQALTVTGAITYGAAIPIVMGQNIGTCVTAMLSAISANKNGKRAAFVHLYFNIIGVVICLSAFSIIDFFANFAFVDSVIDMWGVAAVHTLFKLICVVLLAPFAKYIEKLAVLTIKDKDSENETLNLLDDRLLQTPSVAITRCDEVAGDMAKISCDALLMSIEVLNEYDEKKAQAIRRLEDKADIYEDMLGSYLVKLSAAITNETETKEVTRLLHIIGDFERISDHAVNFVESAEEINDKKLSFSEKAKVELLVLTSAVKEIIGLARDCFTNNDIETAKRIEPLEEVVDNLKDKIKLNHIMRVQKNECSIEHGFVLSDILTNLERVSDHCSNIASCVIEISKNSLDMHRYISSVKNSGEEFDRATREYSRKYSLDKS
jgi:phosphate:Na+ symporter